MSNLLLDLVINKDSSMPIKRNLVVHSVDDKLEYLVALLAVFHEAHPVSESNFLVNLSNVFKLRWLNEQVLIRDDGLQLFYDEFGYISDHHVSALQDMSYLIQGVAFSQTKILTKFCKKLKLAIKMFGVDEVAKTIQSLEKSCVGVEFKIIQSLFDGCCEGDHVKGFGFTAVVQDTLEKMLKATTT